MSDVRSILILDDEKDFRELTKNILKSKFDINSLHEYDPLAQGAPGEEFDWSQYDVLLLDHHLQLENTTGLDILHQNRENENFPVTIMLTASDDEEIAFKALKLGISDFIRKQELTKKILFASINDAIAAKKKKLTKQKNLAKIQKIFNKKYFYKTLKNDIEKFQGIKKRIIIGFKIYEKEDAGIKLDGFIQDRIIRHIAKESCRFFMTNNYQPYITLFNETMVAILFDVEDADFNEKELIKNLHQYHIEVPYINTEKNIEYDFVSCVLSLNEKTVTQEDLIKHFEIACDKAAQNKDINKRIFITTIQSPETTKKQEETDIEEAKTEEVVSKNDFTQEIQKVDTDSSLVKKELYEVEINTEELDEKSKQLITSIEENTIIKTFQPIIMLSNRESEFFTDNDLYYLSSQIIDQDDNEIACHNLLDQITNQEAIKYYDRWLIRETISNIMDIKAGAIPCYFLLKLKQETLHDPTFFNWLRSMLANYEKQSPGKYIILEISQKAISNNEKQVLALIKYLKSSHNFHFALSDVDDLGQLLYLTPKIDIQLVIIDHQKLSDLNLMETMDEKPENYLGYLKRTKRFVVATGISDSTALTTAITLGADLAMGDFIGAPKPSYEEEDAIQSYEIESDEFVSSRL